MPKKLTNDQRRVKRNRFNLQKKKDPNVFRLAVNRSNKNIYAQIINDSTDGGCTIVAYASTIEKENKLENGSNVDAAKAIGKRIAEKAKKLKIKQVVFDRGGYRYHGRVKAVAEAAREAGLTI